MMRFKEIYRNSAFNCTLTKGSCRARFTTTPLSKDFFFCLLTGYFLAFFLWLQLAKRFGCLLRQEQGSSLQRSRANARTTHDVASVRKARARGVPPDRFDYIEYGNPVSFTQPQYGHIVPFPRRVSHAYFIVCRYMKARVLLLPCVVGLLSHLVRSYEMGQHKPQSRFYISVPLIVLLHLSAFISRPLSFFSLTGQTASSQLGRLDSLDACTQNVTDGLIQTRALTVRYTVNENIDVTIEQLKEFSLSFSFGQATAVDLFPAVSAVFFYPLVQTLAAGTADADAAFHMFSFFLFQVGSSFYLFSFLKKEDRRKKKTLYFSFLPPYFFCVINSLRRPSCGLIGNTSHCRL